MSSEDGLSLEEVRTWRVPALKEFCRKRNLKVTGSKEEIVARVFAASEMGIPVQPTNEELVEKTKNEKAELLQVSLDEKITLPDPVSLKEGWLREENGLSSWPPIFLSDITIFLMKDHPGKDVDLHKRVLNEYKEGKAYRLYESGFLKEILYHEVAKESDYCCLKSKCCHTMKISDTPHNAWVFAEKKTGTILSAYCSCVAGMSSSCIHVTALLFRVESANRNGLTNPTCTSKLCVWDVPGTSTDVKPMKIADMDLKSSKLNKDAARPPVDVRRALFEPSVSKKPKTDREKREVLFSHLKDTLPHSCFVLMKKAELEKEPSQPLAKVLKLSQSAVEEIETKTIGQSQNVEWHSERKGRITASNFYKVHTRSETLKSSGGDATKLIDSLMGNVNPPENLYALKYGRNMEHIAKAKYLKSFERNHKNASHRDCGLFVCEDKQFLGASPDLLVECSCCGKGVLEIKCPYSIVNEEPTPINLPYLILNNNQVTLKQNHQYYAQVQGQMAITKRSWCHFMVYTQKGVHLETIKFDHKYCKKLLENLEWFYENYLSTAVHT